MDISDGELLRELKKAVDAAAPDGQAAQAKALQETLRRYDATMDDVSRALAEVRRRRRVELARLAGRIDALAERAEDSADTAESVDAFLRTLGGSGAA